MVDNRAFGLRIIRAYNFGAILSVNYDLHILLIFPTRILLLQLPLHITPTRLISWDLPNLSQGKGPLHGTGSTPNQQ